MRSLGVIDVMSVDTVPVAVTPLSRARRRSVLPPSAAAASPNRRVQMEGTQTGPEQSRGEEIQAAEREAAKRRLLAQAEEDRIPAEETTRAVPDRRWRRGQ
jgi:hypothetical protein